MKLWSLITLVCLLTLSLKTFAEAPLKYSKNRVLIKLKEGASLPKSENIKKIKHLFDRWYVIHTDVDEFEKNHKLDSGIEVIERDYYRRINKLPTPEPEPKMINFDQTNQRSPFNDSSIHRQWALKSSRENGVSVLDAYINQNNRNKKGVIVAVVDTGVEYNHEDLKRNMWVNEGEIAGNGVDDDGNGYIDDIHGINTLVRDRDGEATGSPIDGHGHGTHVAGIIGAVQNNNKGIAGIAQRVKIMAIRTVPNRGDEKDVDVVESFIYAAKNGAKIINCSFGKAHNEGGQAVAEAIEYIGKEHGTLVIAAAGNDSRDIDTRRTYPASFSSRHLLVVGSSEEGGRLSYFSNFGKRNVDVVAPGSSIYSTYTGGKYSYLSGTSMASPVAAGIAAEILSQASHLTPLELKRTMMETVTKKNSWSSKVFSSGRLDLLKGLKKFY
jgi:subtilisin family serine protease